MFPKQGLHDGDNILFDLETITNREGALEHMEAHFVPVLNFCL